MLVLSRKVGETIIIGDAVQLTVVSIRNNQVRLGVTAPLNIRVLREELTCNNDGTVAVARQEAVTCPSRRTRSANKTQ